MTVANPACRVEKLPRKAKVFPIPRAEEYRLARLLGSLLADPTL